MKKILFFLTVVVLFSGCVNTQQNLYTLDKDYLERRSIETRVFDTKNEKELLTASAQVLQDLGYSIKESDVNLGLITAEKNSDVTSKAGKVALATLSILSMAVDKSETTYEDVQKFYVNIVTTPTKEKTIKVRVLFTRKSWDNKGNLFKVEKISDTKTYQQFFDKLSQSVFLTANGI
ncbi:MAG: hypothetical protein IKN42_00245 [Elusimicrobia bacterium]|nr:hypothetical protein [Elusimicrobiota bacterium]